MAIYRGILSYHASRLIPPSPHIETIFARFPQSIRREGGRNQKQASPLFTMGGREPEMGLLIGWPKKGPFLRHISDGLCVGNNKSDFCQILCISGEGLGPFFRSLAIFSEGVNSVRFPFFFFPSLDGHKSEKGPFYIFFFRVLFLPKQAKNTSLLASRSADARR